MKAYLSTFGKFLLLCGTFFIGSVLLLTGGCYLYLSPKLPSAETLRTVRLQTPLRIYSSDQQLIAEFGEKRRNPIDYNTIPKDFINAILSAEDDNFYNHSGVDIRGLMRAAGELLLTGHIRSGGSTITMQLARNFFLTTEQSFIRKFNEILLALRIEDELSKEEIITLYANKIYLGNRAYGIEAAARVYYGTNIDRLSLEQLAMIAGLPKAPSAYNPLANPERATSRRNWILNRMHKLGYIDQKQLHAALTTQDNASYHSPHSEVEAPYVAEMARREILDRWGPDAYTEGYIATLSIDGSLQEKANQALRSGVLAYDWRHGYRGPERHVKSPSHWGDVLKEAGVIDGMLPAIVTKVAVDQAEFVLPTGEPGVLNLAENNSVRRFITEDSRSAVITDFNELWNPGDLIRVRRQDEGYWQLAQRPKAQAALVSLDPENGGIRALVGGFDFDASHFNRVTQAQRQPGSNFKPFIYTAALERGMSAATLINDAPVVFQDPYLEKVWRPENDSGKFYGPTPLRKALYLSRNLVSIRILRQLGVKRTIASMERFGFDISTLPQNLSLALGTQGATPLSIANGYAAFANGGFRVHSYLIEKLETIEGQILYQAQPATVCRQCSEVREENPIEEPPPEEASSLQELLIKEEEQATAAKLEMPISDTPPRAKRIVDARIAYIMDSILKDVIKKGTGQKARILQRSDIGGKTGTTNGPRDAWFSGYSPHLATTVWLGFDQNLLLGKGEYGGSAALPIWIDFMATALKGKPEIHHPLPPGLVTVRIDPTTGKRVNPGDPGGVNEYFLEERIPALPSGNQRSKDRSSSAGIPDELF